MNLVAWLVAGTLMAFVVSAVSSSTPRQALPTNLVAGVAGAVLAGWLVTSLLAGTSISSTDSNVVGLIVAVGGAVTLLAMMHTLRRRVAN